MVIEMVIPQLAERGGLDRFINDFADFLIKKGNVEFRIVQLVDTGLCWWIDGIEPVCMCSENENPTFFESAVRYENYLKKVESKPDIILATGWPITISIVRQAIDKAEIEVVLVGYPHMTMQEGVEKQVGGLECLEDADVIFSISKQIENEIQAIDLRKPVVRVNNGIRFPEKVLNRDLIAKTRKLIYVGRLVPGKNIQMVFRAIAKAKAGWYLQLVGQGDMESCKKQASEYGIIEQVEFCGFKENPYENTDDVMFCIIPSNYEGFCMVIPEALSHGIPVISTPVGCATEVIKPGVNGYLIGIDDSEMLCQVLDLISQGSLPIPKSTICVDSVKEFELQTTLEKLYEELITLYKH